MTSILSTPVGPHAEKLKELGGTDLLFTTRSPVLGRVNGGMQPLADRSFDESDIRKILEGTLTTEQIDRLDQDKEVDFSLEWEGTARFRGNAFFQRGAPAMCLRMIPYRIPTFDELGLPAVLDQLTKLPQGFVLFTGPTGSGKSTTQASMLDRINDARAAHILTIEDPIEYIHTHKKSAVSQREIGQDSDSFPRALRSALREDPDVLLVGEMRDPESISTALTIAETGHLVFATLHTNDTGSALDRIVDVFPADRQAQIRVQLSTTLQAIVAQRLLPKKGGGLVAAFEVLIATPAVRNLIKEGKSHQIRNVIMTSQEQGMQTLETGLNQLVEQGLVSYDDAVARSVHPKEIKQQPPTAPPTAAG